MAPPTDEEVSSLNRKDLKEFAAGRVLEFTLQIENPDIHNYYPNSEELEISVVDSYVCFPVGKPPFVATLFVPYGREGDMLYSTHVGLRRLLYQFRNVVRLIVVKSKVKSKVKSLEAYSRLKDLRIHNEDHPDPRDLAHSALINEIQDICLGIRSPRRLSHQEDVRYIDIRFDGLDHSVYGIYVEDVDIDVEEGLGMQIRRRMRFKDVPHIFQADCVVEATRNGAPVIESLETLVEGNQDGLALTIDLEKLDVRTQAMLYGCQVISDHLNEKFLDSNVQLQVLSLGFGVGILERVLKTKFNAEVLSVEKDCDLQSLGEVYFSSSIADEWEGLNIIYKFDAGDVIVALGGIEATDLRIDLIEACDPYKSRTYDLVFVDMVDVDIYPMVGACAPPRGFIKDLVFNNIKHLLHQQGALVIHVIAPDSFFEMDLKNILENHFLMIYKLRLEKDFEFVIVATNSICFATSQEYEENEAFGIINSLVTQRFNIAKFKGA